MISRPMSQLGLSGMAIAPNTAGSNRFNIHDKRYYVSAIQNHMQQLNDEINRLKKQLNDSKLEATNYEEVKKQSEQSAQQLAELEEQLMIYNTAIETVMFKGNKHDIDAEAESIRASKQEKIQQLEQMYTEKVKLEDELSKITKELETEKQQFEIKIMELPEEQRNKYFSLKEERENLKREEYMIEEKIKNYKKNIENYEQQIFRNDKKAEFYNLSMKLNDIQKRFQKLEEENKVKRSPSQEREYLLEQVKQDRADIEVLKSQCEEEKNELQKQRERLSELEDELSEKNSARLNKYKELLKRQETMTTFLEAFPKLYNEEMEKAKELSNTIVHYLEYISTNSLDNATPAQEVDPNYIYSTNLTTDDVKREYKKYKMQLDMLNSVVDRHKTELEELKKKEEKLTAELVEFEDIEQAKQDLQQQQLDLETTAANLNTTLKSTISAVQEAEKRKAEIQAKLENNEQYKIVVNLENQLQKLIEENEKLQEVIENTPGLRDFQKFKTKSIEEVKLIFDDLKIKLQKK